MECKSSRRKNREWQPDTVEFDDGARDVPFVNVPFLPPLQAEKSTAKLTFSMTGT